MSATNPARPAAAVASAEPDAGRRARRRRRWVAGVVAAAVVVGASAAAEALSRPGSPAPAGPSYPTSTRIVTRRSLTSQILVSATLVPVSVGLFDDADGLVQVSGARLAAGQHVVVPGT